MGKLDQWAHSSAGEHRLHTAGVAGSIPAAPTIYINGLDDLWLTHCLGAHSIHTETLVIEQQTCVFLLLTSAIDNLFDVASDAQ